ncbi:ATPase [Halopseudomonas bauzanensis]|nr:ATPase [Halopseudomonas bauzanensis]
MADDVIREVRHLKDESDAEGLVTISVSHSHSEQPSKNKKPARWITSDETLSIGGKTISGAYLYHGGLLAAVGRYGIEASLLDESLSVIPSSSTYEDDSLSYWPKYSTISPRCRGAYLSWLEGGRKHPETPIGYVFIYFYGLERRIIADASKANQVPDTEYENISREIFRLISVYHSSPPFRNYAYRLLEWMTIQRPHLVSLNHEEMAKQRLELAFAIQAGTAVLAGSPISADMALSWLYFTEWIPKTPARRCKDQFAKLFCIKYQEKYGAGFIVKPNKRFLKAHYQPASSTLSYISSGESKIPNPVGLKSVQNRLVEIAEQCNEELRPYSSYIGRNEGTEKTLTALALLPKPLFEQEPSSIEFRSWAAEIITEHDGIISFTDLLGKISPSPVDKLRKATLDTTQLLLDKTGYAYAPDSRFHDAKPTLDGPVVLSNDPLSPEYQPTQTFNEVSMSLRLGAMVASIDGQIDEEEVLFLQGLISGNERLSSNEKSSLFAYFTWRLNSPHNLVSLKSQIQKLSDDAKRGISKILIKTAMADGTISPAEIKQMEKLYVSLGLDRAMLAGDIHGVATLKPLKTETFTASKPRPTGFHLDTDIIAQHEDETRDVQGMLREIFADTEEDTTAEEPVEQSPAILEDDDDGLDPQHRHLYSLLVSKEKWSRDEVHAFCEPLGLMVDGAVEAINDWAFEKVDDAVLDDDGDIYIRLDVAQELEN